MDINRYQALLDPFEGANPVGDINNKAADELYDKLNSELSRADGLNPKPIDWLLIEEISFGILANHAKDLRVAGYLTEALRRLYGLNGLTEGIKLLSLWLECEYTQQLFPQRREKRQNKAWVACIKWSYDRFEPYVLDITPNQANLSDLVALADAFIELDNILQKRFQDIVFETFKLLNHLKLVRSQAIVELEKQSNLVHLKDEQDKIKPKSALKSMADGIKKVVGITDKNEKKKAITQDKSVELPNESSQVTPNKKVIEQQTPFVETPAAVSPVINEPKSKEINAGNIEKHLNQASREIRNVAQFIHNNDIRDSQSYYLNRIAMWMTLDTLPASNILPRQPNQQQYEQLQSDYSAGEFHAVIREAEKHFTAGAIFNLDLQYLIVKSLDKVGAGKASELIKLMVSQLVNRFSGITEMTFQNNDAVASAQTKQWLASLFDEQNKSTENSPVTQDNLAQNVSQTNTITSDGSQNFGAWERAYQRLKSQAGQDNDNQNIATFVNGVRNSDGLREQCYWQLAMAKYCNEAKHFELAIAQLEDLLQKVDKASIAVWEPKLRVDIIANLLQCHEQNMAHKGFNDVQKREFRLELKNLFDELSVLAPERILSLNL